MRFAWVGLSAWNRCWHLSTKARAQAAAESFISALVVGSDSSVSNVRKLAADAADLLAREWTRARESAIASSRPGGPVVTPDGIGKGTARVYLAIRKDLGIPMYRGVQDALRSPQEGGRTVGDSVKAIAAALRAGTLDGLWSELFAEA